MSKILSRHCALIAWSVCTLAITVHLDAQSPANEDSLSARIRTLDSVVAVRRRTVDSARRSLMGIVPKVEVKDGPLSVRTTPELEARVRGAVALTAKLIEDIRSPHLASQVASHVPAVRRDSTPVGFGFVPVISIAPDSTRRWYSTMRIKVSITATAAHIADRLSMFVEQFALEGADSTLSAWVMAGRLPLRPTSDDNARDVYIEFAANESSAIRRCRAGAIDACLDALGLDSASGPRLARWYAPEDYGSLLHRVAPPREDSTAVAAWLRCRGDNDQDSCVVAARLLPDASVPYPFSGTARLMLTRQALEIGGAGAYDRLIAPAGSVRARLEAAATKPMDVVVRRWLARTEAARPTPMKVRAGATIVSLGWCGLFLAVGITRRRSCA